MKTEMPNSRARDLFTLACGSAILLIIILIVNRDYPWVGHDYAYFVPHILDAELHIRLNGLTIQWYTPSFGGGLPGYPNPQHTEYSLAQLLTLWINPWAAVLVSTAAISLSGYYVFYKFLKERLDLNWRSSTLGAMFFLANGFYIEHLIAGQFGYQLFPLAAIILYVLTDRRNQYILHGTIIATVLVLMVFQAGFYLIVILILSLSITLPTLYLYKPEAINPKNILLTLIVAAVLSTAVSASKIYAVAAFMNHFPRQVFDFFEIDLFQAMMGLVAQFLGVMVLLPILSFSGQNVERLSGALANLTGARYGIWEIDTGLSPILVIFLVAGLASGISRLRKGIQLPLDRSSRIAILLLVLSTWIALEMTFAKGIIYTLTKQLPILKSLHVNVRFAAAFIVPLIIVGTFRLHNFFVKNSKTLYFAAFLLLTLVSLFSFFGLAKDVHSREFNVSSSNRIHEQIRSGDIFPVSQVANINPRVGFVGSLTSTRPYEPIFGYDLEEFKPQIHYGSVFETNDGYFNMTNPASLVFPEINHLHPFERFKVSERDQLEAFLARRQPEWVLPAAQKVLNVFSLLALILDVGLFVVAGLAGIKAGAGRRAAS